MTHIPPSVSKQVESYQFNELTESPKTLENKVQFSFLFQNSETRLEQFKKLLFNRLLYRIPSLDNTEKTQAIGRSVLLKNETYKTMIQASEALEDVLEKLEAMQGKLDSYPELLKNIKVLIKEASTLRKTINREDLDEKGIEEYVNASKELSRSHLLHIKDMNTYVINDKIAKALAEQQKIKAEVLKNVIEVKKNQDPNQQPASSIGNIEIQADVKIPEVVTEEKLIPTELKVEDPKQSEETVNDIKLEIAVESSSEKEILTDEKTSGVQNNLHSEPQNLVPDTFQQASVQDLKAQPEELASKPQ